MKDLLMLEKCYDKNFIYKTPFENSLESALTR